MTCFRCGESRFDRLFVPHLPDQDDVGILTHGIFECGRKAFGIFTHTTVRKDRFFILMDKFHRIFDGDDMFLFIFIDLIEQCRQCGRLTRAGRPCHQDQPFFSFDQFFENLWCSEIVKRGNLYRNDPEGRCHFTECFVVVRPESSDTRKQKCEVEFAVLFEVLFLLLCDQRVAHLFDIISGKLGKVDRFERPVESDLRFRPADEVKIRCAVCHDTL